MAQKRCIQASCSSPKKIKIRPTNWRTMKPRAHETQFHLVFLLSLPRPSQPNKKKCFFLASFSHGGAPPMAPRPWRVASCAPPHPTPTPTMIHRLRGYLRAHLEHPRRRRRRRRRRRGPRSPRQQRARLGPKSLRTPTFPSTSGTHTRRRTHRGSPSGSASPPGSRPSAPAALTGHGTVSPPREEGEGMEKAMRGAGWRSLGNRCRRRRSRSWLRGTGTAIAHGR
jgi:hypothetical protein